MAGKVIKLENDLTRKIDRQDKISEIFQESLAPNVFATALDVVMILFFIIGITALILTGRFDNPTMNGALAIITLIIFACTLFIRFLFYLNKKSSRLSKIFFKFYSSRIKHN